MKNKIAPSITGVLALFLGLAWSSQAPAQTPVTVKTNQGSGLDMRATENGLAGSVTYATNGGGNTLDVRYNGYNNGFPQGDAQGDADNDDKNEFAVLRFDLSTVDKSMINNPSILLTNYRGPGSNRKDLRIWGVNPSNPTLNTFPENSPFVDIPGFAAGDNDTTTQGVSTTAASFLGDFLFPLVGEPPAEAGEGAVQVITQSLLDSTSFNGTSAPSGTSQVGGGVAVQNTLQGYLQSLGPADMAVFIIGGIASNGQGQFASKEAVQTSTGLLMGAAGDFAPALQFTLGSAVENAHFNGDTQVDGDDLMIWQRNVGSPGGLADGDADDSGTIDGADLAIWRDHFGQPMAAPSGSPVPEPACGVLAAIAGAFAAVARRRRG
jgi:hypothetical protein